MLFIATHNRITNFSNVNLLLWWNKLTSNTLHARAPSTQILSNQSNQTCKISTKINNNLKYKITWATVAPWSTILETFCDLKNRIFNNHLSGKRKHKWHVHVKRYLPWIFPLQCHKTVEENSSSRNHMMRKCG